MTLYHITDTRARNRTTYHLVLPKEGFNPEIYERLDFIKARAITDAPTECVACYERMRDEFGNDKNYATTWEDGGADAWKSFDWATP